MKKQLLCKYSLPLYCPWIISGLLLASIPAMAQEEEEHHMEKNEWQFEQQAMKEEALPPDDEQQLSEDDRRRKPLDLNKATATELEQLQLLQPWQISTLLLYRNCFGRLLSIYELQAVPGWDEILIRKIRPFVSVGDGEDPMLPFFRRFKGGETLVMWRMGKLLESSKPSSFVRYRYKLDKQLQWGITGEKDEGERFFRGAQKNGFDFYGAHLFARNIGPLRVLALGDFQVNMGQGLVQWQGMSFAAGAVLSAKKSSEVLLPYSGAGEFNFHRGVGVSAGRKNWYLTGFVSSRKLAARNEADSSGAYVTGLISSGYHRSESEQATKNAQQLLATGGCLKYSKPGRQFGLNFIHYSFGLPFKKPEPLYKLFAVTGKSWYNASIDYGMTVRNLHLFGELALDKERSLALITGMMCNMNTALQAAITYRNLSKAYQGFFNSAVTQSSAPSNEEGISLRIDWQWQRKYKLQATLDRFRFPWLKYRINAEANGYEYLLMMHYQPTRKSEWQFRYQLSSKPLNMSDTIAAMPFPGMVKREQWRIQCSWTISQRLRLMQRIEYLQAKPAEKKLQESGMSIWLDGTCKLNRKWMFNARVHFYETGSYLSRIYGFERDLLYSYSMPAFSGQSIRAYVLLRYKPVLNHWFNRLLSLECWIKFARAWNPDRVLAAEEPVDEKPKNELRAQVLIRFR